MTTTRRDTVVAGNNRDTIGACLARARAVLTRADADAITTGALAVDRAALYGFPERGIDRDQTERHARWLERRIQGEPLAYITGEREFWSLPLRIDENVLIPRPDTETLVEAAIHLATSDSEILDLGTGSGAVALALAKETGARVTAVDIDPHCIEIAAGNASRLGIEIQFAVSNWYDHVDGQFDLLVSNPPYLPEADPHLSRGDLRYEPKRALTSGVDGLDAIRNIVQGAREHLKPGGYVVTEHGYDQARATCEIFAEAGFVDITTSVDLAGHARVTQGRLV